VGGGPTVVAGHSMGGYVAVVLAARRPELVGQLVLVDGGLPFPIALDGIDPDAAMEATLGPALARLSQTFASWEAYRDFWKVHPSFVGEWNEAVEEYARYDLVGDPPDMRSRVSADAVRDDGRDMLVNIAQIQDALRALRCPTHLFWAPRNIMNEPSPIQPAELIDHWKSVLPNLTAEVVPDTNHYVIAMGERGARIIAARLEAAVMASAAS
jgi:pimeloyl-ACP methyl ester carboxylesterase